MQAKPLIAGGLALLSLIVSAPSFAKEAAIVNNPNNPSKALLSAHIMPDGSVVASHGVTSVTHPLTGVYCILPSAAKLQLNIPLLAPVMSADFRFSPDAQVFVQLDSQANCPPNTMGVITFLPGLNGYVTADESFTILVE